MLHTVPPDHPFAPTLIPSRIAHGPVRLGVTEAERALSVWRDLVGLSLITQTDRLISLGADGRILVELETGASGPATPGSSGLYHVAIHVADRPALASVIARLLRAGHPCTAVDHLAAEVCYLADLDGNGIEITHETPWRGYLNPRLGQPGQPVFVDYDGNAEPGRIPAETAFRGSDTEVGLDIYAPLTGGVRVGHVHLSVADVTQAMDFYNGVLGLSGQLFTPRMGIGDVSTSLSNHFVAFNTWGVTTATPPLLEASGLRFFTLVLPTTDDLRAMAFRLESAGHPVRSIGGGIETSDPSGNRVRAVNGDLFRGYLKGDRLPSSRALSVEPDARKRMRELVERWRSGSRVAIDDVLCRIDLGNGQTITLGATDDELRVTLVSPEREQLPTLQSVVADQLHRLGSGGTLVWQSTEV